jgi:hypothetical protein
VNNGTFAATTLGDAMSIQPSVSPEELAARKTVLRQTVMDSLDDAINRNCEEDGEAALSGSEGETG